MIAINDRSQPQIDAVAAETSGGTPDDTKASSDPADDTIPGIDTGYATAAGESQTFQNDRAVDPAVVVTDNGQGLLDRLSSLLSDRPIASLGTVFAAGWVLAFLTRSRPPSKV